MANFTKYETVEGVFYQNDDTGEQFQEYVNDSRYKAFKAELDAGTHTVVDFDPNSDEIKGNNERFWRDSELLESDLILLKALANEEGYNLGTVKTWRQELRDYPQQPGFPNNARPTRP